MAWKNNRHLFHRLACALWQPKFAAQNPNDYKRPIKLRNDLIDSKDSKKIFRIDPHGFNNKPIKYAPIELDADTQCKVPRTLRLSSDQPPLVFGS